MIQTANILEATAKTIFFHKIIVITIDSNQLSNCRMIESNLSKLTKLQRQLQYSQSITKTDKFE